LEGTLALYASPDFTSQRGYTAFSDVLVATTMKIAQPTTMLTDYVLGAVCVVVSFKLLRQKPVEGPVQLWGIAFSFVAFSALTGGTWHGSGPNVDTRMLAILWKSTVYATGVFDLLIVAGSVLATVGSRVQTWLLPAVGAKFLIYAVWMAGHDDFLYVVLDSACAMALLLILHGYALWVRGDRASPWIITAVLVSALAATAQASGFALPPYLNHNDLYHLIQTVVMLLFYQAGKRLRTYSAVAN
jgi:Family of unknown function (DUF6962)